MLSRFSLRKQLPAGFLPGLLAGATAGFTRLYPEWAPLQFAALALFGWALSREKDWKGILRLGFWFGAALAGVTLSKVHVGATSAEILLVALALYWMMLGAGLAYFIRLRTFAGIWAAAGLLTFGEWAQIYVLPMFGTAQRISAAWVDSPTMLFASRIGGTTLVTFVVALVAFFLPFVRWRKRIRTTPLDAENYLRQRRLENGFFVVCSLILLLQVAGKWIHRPDKSSKSVTVAVCGAENRESAFLPPPAFKRKFGAMVAEAAGKGAKIVVTPELALDVSPGNRDAVLAGFAADAQRLGVTWVLGFSEGGRARPGSLNRSVILNADRPVGAIYDKSHWVPFMETYAKTGDARPPVVSLPAGVRLGTMICQDDNFENVSRNLSLSGATIVGVPTFDWPGVAEAHLDSARNRPREFGFVEARAALGGISAIIDPAGRILASWNHLTDDDGIAIANVQIGAGGPTVFARCGDWPALLLSGAGISAGLAAVFRPGRRKNAGDA